MHTFSLLQYAVFIILLAILQIAAGIAGGVLKNKISEKFEKGLCLTTPLSNHSAYRIILGL